MSDDLSLSVGIRGTSDLEGVVGGTIKQLRRIGKAVERTDKAMEDVRGYRAQRQAVARATVEMRRARRASGTLGRAVETATREVARQRAELDRQGRSLRRAGVDVGRLADAERRLTRTLERQTKARGRLEASAGRRRAATERRREVRGDVVEAAAVGYSMVRPIGAAVRAAVDFESTMADIAKVVDFPAPDGLKELGRDILALSGRIPVAAAELGKIVEAAGQAGIATGELQRFAADAAHVGVAFDLSGLEAGAAMTGLREIFKANQQQAMDIAGSYNHLSNNMDATAAGMLNIANRAGSTGALFGLTGQQVGALGATFLALKTPPEVAATGINAMLMKLMTAEKQGAKFQSALESMGMSAAGLQQQIGRDAQGALLDFLDAIAESDDVSGTLFDLFGQEYADDMTKLVGARDRYRQAVKLAAAEEARAASVYAESNARAQTTGSAVVMLRNKAISAGIAIGGALLPAIVDVADAVGPLVERFAAWAEAHPGAVKGVMRLGAALVGAKVGVAAWRYAAATASSTAAAFGAGSARLQSWMVLLGGAIGRATTRLRLLNATLWTSHGALGRVPVLGAAAAGGVGRVTTAVRVLRAALISTGIGAIVVAIGVAVAWLVAKWDGVKAFFGGFAAGIGAVLGALGPVGDVIRSIGGAIGSVVGWFGDLFSVDPMAESDVEKWEAWGRKAGATVGGALTAAIPGARRTVGAAVVAATTATTAVSAERPAAPTPGAAVSAEQLSAERPVPSAALDAPISPAAPAAATASSIRVESTIHVHPPAGADEQAIAREVARQLAAAMRRATVEAGLSESDA